ncbi:MAG: LacI family DNA-binding transcriptional regulator [Clostridiaceae bacterium]
MPNRNDVAARAGVSPAVVSYVLNDSNYVSIEKREAVLKAIDELGYHPSYVARSLKSKRTHQLLLLADNIQNEIFSEMGYYMEQYAFEKGYYLSMASCSRKKAMDYVDVFYSRHHDGIFLASNVYTSEEMNHFAEKGVSLVLFQTRIYQDLSPKITVIGGDFMRGVETAIDYLIEQKGHRYIGYLGGPGIPTTPEEPGPFGEGLRINGFLNSIRRHGLPINMDMLSLSSATTDMDIFDKALDDLVKKIFSIPAEVRPTAFFATDDRSAARFVRHIQEHGYSVPEDMQVIGFGNTYSSHSCRPQLTTVNLPKQEISQMAVEALIAKSMGETHKNVLFPMELIIRQSA